jgi:hypothetical protein
MSIAGSHDVQLQHFGRRAMGGREEQEIKQRQQPGLDSQGRYDFAPQGERKHARLPALRYQNSGILSQGGEPTRGMGCAHRPKDPRKRWDYGSSGRKSRGPETNQSNRQFHRRHRRRWRGLRHSTNIAAMHLPAHRHMISGMVPVP